MSQSNERVFIGVGSNIDPQSNIAKAFSLLATRVELIAVSTMYVSKPLMGRDIPRFINGVWEIRTALSPRELVYDVLKKIEAEIGRTTAEDKYGSRSLDLDLLLYGSRVETEGRATLPHPDIRERPFVAIPLFELTPGLMLPDSGESLSSIAGSMSAEGLIPVPELTRFLKKGIIHE